MGLTLREAFGNTLVELIPNKDVVVLDADLSHATKILYFSKECPERFINMGIAEADMLGTAAGLALSGKIPFACSFAVFSVGRAFDQIRNTICYSNLNVKIVGTHTGISVGEDGGTHQSVEDIALTRSLPNMVIFSPCDDVETRLAVLAAVEHKGPVYLRISRIASPTIHEKGFVFTPGKGEKLRDGKDITIIATGVMVAKALEACDLLLKEGIKATVINISTIKPLDEDLITSSAKETGNVITVEEHSIYGGLGGAVCEVLSKKQPTKVSVIGINDSFGKSGNPDKLFEHFGLTVDNIVKTAKEMIGKAE